MTAATIVLHHCIDARSFRPLWALEELGLRYELVVLPFPPRVQKPEYLELNPLGTVPAFRDGAVFMTESAAICQYLADRHPAGGLGVAAGDAAYGDYLNGLHYGEATLTFPQTLILRYARFEPPERRQPQVAEDYTRWFLSRLRRVNEVVATRDYWCGARFSAADISVGYALMLAEQIGLRGKFAAAVDAYWQRLSERAGYRRALHVQHEAALAQGVAPVSPAG